MTPWLSTTDVNEPVKRPRSRSLNRSRTVACAASARAVGAAQPYPTAMGEGAAGRRAGRTSASLGSPTWPQYTVISVAGKLSSDATCLLKSATARPPPASGAAQTCAPACSACTRRAPGAPARRGARRARLLGALLPDQVARHAERVLVDGDHLARLEQHQRLPADRPARAPRARVSPRRSSRQALRAARPHSAPGGPRLRSAPMMSGLFTSAHSAKCARCSVWLSLLPTGRPTCAPRGCAQGGGCMRRRPGRAARAGAGPRSRPAAAPPACRRRSTCARHRIRCGGAH